MVVVSVSYVCNSRCPSCPFTQSDLRNSYRDALFIAPELFKKIAQQCGQYGALLRITGGGEPLLHPEMVDLIEYAGKAGARVGLITNGSLLTPDRTERLLNSGIEAVEISADAADEKTYSKVRVGLDFPKLVQNVRYLVLRRDNLKSRTKVIVSIVDQKELSGKMEATVSFWKKIVDKVQVRKYLTWGIGDASMSRDPTPFFKDRVPCPLPFERIVLDSRGKAVLCNTDIAGETDFGNAKDTPIADIWRGEKFEAVRELLLARRYEDIPLCAKCADWKYRSWNYNYWKVLGDAVAARTGEDKGRLE